MTYSSGSTILDDDYNIFATGNAAGTGDNTVANINTVWGTGTGDKGYGQTTTVSPVSAGSTITATQWATLLTRMTSLANHQGTTITAISNPSTGDTISAYAALSANITAVFNGRLNAAGVGTDITTNGSNTTTNTWSTSAIIEKQYTWSSATTLRYFFNAGGQIRTSWSLTGGSDAKSVEWADLLTKSGTIVCSGSGTSKTINSETLTGTTKIGGSGTPTTLLTGTGTEDYTSVYVEIYKQYADTAPYTANYIKVEAKLGATTNIIAIKTSLIDDAVDTTGYGGAGDALDIVDGTLNQTTLLRPPSTTYITATWGSPTIDTGTWSVS